MAASVMSALSLGQTARLGSRQKTSAEVIVLGGGFSGLWAAYEAQKRGLTCLVLEKGDSFGGYWDSTERSRHDHEIDENLHPRVMSMLHELGLDSELLEKRKIESDSCLTGDISLLDAHDRRSFTRVRDNLESLSQKLDINKPSQLLPQFGNMTVKELARSHGATLAILGLADTWTQSIFGVSADQVSALTFLLHCKTHGGFRQALDGSGRWTLGDGLREAIVDRLHPGSVIPFQDVERIDQTAGNKIILTTRSGGVYQCTNAIMDLPLSEYGQINMSPKVSESKQWLWEVEPSEATYHLPIPAANLKNLEEDQWQPEDDVYFAGSETSYTWRGHIEGALAAGSRAVDEILQQLRPNTEALVARL